MYGNFGGPMKKKRVLVFGAHADDEVIGMGGTLRKLADAGAHIRLVLFSAGAEGYSSLAEREGISARRDTETRRVCNILGIAEYVNLGLLDWNMKVDNAAYRAVIEHIRGFRPDMVFTHTHADYNDHQVVNRTVTEGWYHASVACAMGVDPITPRMPLYEFEVLQPMASPGIVTDITETFRAKQEAMACYASQHQVVGGVFQMMEGRALDRGSLVGVKYGEAFTRSAYRPKLVTDMSQLADSEI